MKNIKTIKQNQTGFAHLTLIVAFVAVIAAVGFAGYSVAMKQRLNREADARRSAEIKAEEDAAKLAELKLKEVEAQKDDDEPIEVTTKAEVKRVEEKKTTTTTTKTEPKATYIKFSDVDDTFENETLRVIAALPKSYSGTCKLYLTKDGEAYKKPIEVSSTNKCDISIEADELPEGGTWKWVMYFWTKDGLVNASSPEYSQEF